MTNAFGDKIRELRQKKEISLRKFAAMVNMTPTYLSKIERGDMKPPGEDKVRAIAKALDQDVDELLALAGRVASDLPEIIKRKPREMASFLRTIKDFSNKDLQDLVNRARNKKNPGKS